MLLDGDPGTLIHHTIGNFNIHPDKQAVTRIDDSLSTLQQSRDLRIREAESSMHKLSRHLHSLRTQHEEAVAIHDSGKHAAEIVELDTKKFRIAKTATELEIESERLEGELEMLKERLADLEAQGLEGDETTRREREMDDATMWVLFQSNYIKYTHMLITYNSLRLKIFRSLGIDIEPDEAGNFHRAVIRNSRKGDVHVVNIDPKFSRFFYSNYFWQTMQG
ncbi:hypothetical protein N7478_003011 [Penicillium angulare]|uniref:uncharacterized protein n=1 Tax=Penicillium angulare TaxID=116970 RepID=UPI00253F999D|nr:uncharacterized protein N7478_003011 [Penicillium angulare]KAJ5287325.1 hypothetical protein N7478_003011 [Penicillium angulare]